MKDNQPNMNRAIQFAVNSKQELENLDSMIGMDDYKVAMRQIIATQKRMIIAHSKGRTIRPPFFSHVFSGQSRYWQDQCQPQNC